jgi:hypothetical protein
MEDIKLVTNEKNEKMVEITPKLPTRQVSLTNFKRMKEARKAKLEAELATINTELKAVDEVETEK